MTEDYQGLTPPPELVHQWANHSASVHRENGTYEQHEFAIAAQAARWGADQELDACCELLTNEWGNGHGDRLHRLRRPKPPSLKAQALKALLDADGADHPVPVLALSIEDAVVIRRALEQLDD
jgi:hypothetical protein